MIAEETQFMRKSLHEKSEVFKDVAQHLARLFFIVRQVCALSPYYHITLTQFYEIVKTALRNSDRGKSGAGEKMRLFLANFKIQILMGVSIRAFVNITKKPFTRLLAVSSILYFCVIFVRF